MHRLYSLLTLLLLGFIGCGKPVPTVDPTKPGVEKPHEHGASGPSGGVLATWGKEEYHAEFVVDHPTGEATVFILDGTAKKVTAIDAKSITLALKETPPIAVTLNAQPQEGDPAGTSSRYVGKHAVLKTVKEFSGSISGKTGGKNYTGDFEEKPDVKK